MLLNKAKIDISIILIVLTTYSRPKKIYKSKIQNIIHIQHHLHKKTMILKKSYIKNKQMNKKTIWRISHLSCVSQLAKNCFTNVQLVGK